MALSNITVTSQLAKRTIFALNAVGKNNKVSVSWVRAHVGTEGNEKADELAKNGTTSSREIKDIKKPSAPIKLKLRQKMNKIWDERWRSLPGHRQSKYWLNEQWRSLHEALYKLPREDFGLVLQFITGFNNLNYHTHNKNNRIPPTCRKCGEQREEAIHFVLDCPATQAASTKLFGPLGPERNEETTNVIWFALSPVVKHCLKTRTVENL